MREDNDDRPTKRPTPSSPMAALNPSVFVDPDTIEVSLDDESRDQLMLKTIARVERIDTEVETLITSVIEGNRDLKKLKYDLVLVTQEVTIVRKQMVTVKQLLAEILGKVS